MITIRLNRIGKRVFEQYYNEWISDSIFSSLEKLGYTKNSINTRVSNARSLFKSGDNEEALQIAKSRAK